MRGRATLVVLLVLLGAQAASASVIPRVRIGAAPPLPAGSMLVADRATVRSLEVMVALRPRDPQAMAAYARAVSTPGSALYRHDLSVQQFARRFGATGAAISAVERALRARGLDTGNVSANHLTLYVRGSGDRLARAFATTLATVRLRSGRVGYLNLRAPAIDRRAAPYVQAILGLDSLVSASDGYVRGPRRRVREVKRARERPHVLTGGPQPCEAAIKAVSPDRWGPGWTADQVASAYDFGPLYRSGDKGQGITVAVYEQEPNLRSDVLAFQRCYGTHAAVSYIKVDGGSGSGPGSGEAAGDIDQIISFAPKAQILVYDGPANSAGNSDPTLDAIVSQDRAQVISSSWGECEPEEGLGAATVDDNLLEEAAIQGQTFVVAAGDDGAEDCYVQGSDNNKVVSVDSPGSSPWATAVGGTLLSSISPPAETTWNNVLSNNIGASGTTPGAGGGGVSKFWPMPAYQSGAPAALGVISSVSSGTPCGAASGSYCREVPDVSANADPMEGYATYVSGGWETWGGTSAATPIWAALFALADATQGCVNNKVGFVNPALYALAGQSQATYFNDVTTGNNDILKLNGGEYAAGVGYDMATGLGTPRAAALADALCGETLQLHLVGVQRLMHLGHQQLVQLRPAVIPTGVTGVVFHAAHMPAGLVLNPSTGQVTGEPTQTGLFHVSFWLSGSGQTVSAPVRAWWTVLR